MNPGALTNPMTQDPLSQLRDIHLPQELSGWPLALGWNLLIGFLILFVMIAALLAHRYWLYNRYKYQALKELKGLEVAFEQSLKEPQLTAQLLSALLKRVALTLYPRSEIAGLQTEAWLLFLDELSNSQFFTLQEGKLLGHPLFINIESLSIEAQQSYRQQLQVVFHFSESLIRKLKTRWSHNHA